MLACGVGGSSLGAVDSAGQDQLARLVTHRKDIFQALAPCFDGGPAGKHFGRRVHQLHTTESIGDDHRIADAVQYDTQFLLLLEHRRSLRRRSTISSSSCFCRASTSRALASARN